MINTHSQAGVGSRLPIDKVRFAIFIGSMALVVANANAASIVEEEPSFSTVIGSQPIVVHAKYVKSESETIDEIPAINGNVDPHPALRQGLNLSRYAVAEVLKGKIPKEFVVRSVVTGKMPEGRPGITESAQYLMVLSPDYGRDASGEHRTTYVVTYGARYVVDEGKVRIIDSSGQTVDERSLEQIREMIRVEEKRTARREALSPEPLSARFDPVIAGEDKAAREDKLPIAPQLRPKPALSADQLRGSKPNAIEGPKGHLK